MTAKTDEKQASAAPSADTQDQPKPKAKPKADPKPKAEDKPEAVAEDAHAKAKFPCHALVKKFDDRLPVEVKDAAHLAKLREMHGAQNVEVQP